MGDKPVFKIRPLDSTDDSRDRILHRNMLFPLQSKVQTDAVETTTVLSKADQLMDPYFDIKSQNEDMIDFSRGDKHSAHVNF